jgi:glycosyltransferase involved in cell wall biosynthesis
MRIGIDAKWYFNGPPSGRRVVRNLVKHLATTGRDEIHVFTDAAFRNRKLDIDVDARLRHHLWAGNNQLSNLVVLPRIADGLGLDAVVYQNFVPLRTKRHARIALVYDAIFDTHPEFFTRVERLYFSSLRRLVRSADRVCTGSEAERARLIALGYVAPGSIDVVPNAVDDVFLGAPIARQEARRDLASRGIPQRFVLFVGRVTARKNVGAIVRALPLVAGERIALVIAGPHDDTAADFAAAMRESSIRDQVHRLGAVSDEMLRALYAAATVFCFPSFDEGFGLPPLEAMALGAPCVVSDIPVLREVCGDAALYVDPRDPSAIAGAIDALLRDDELRARLRAEGPRRASGFRWDATASALIATVHRAARVPA